MTLELVGQHARKAEGKAMKKSMLLAGVALLTLSGALVSTAPSASAATSVWMLKDYQTGRCLDSNAAGKVYTNPCGGTNNYQKWYVINTSPYRFQNKATGLCLDGWLDGVKDLSASDCISTAGNLHLWARSASSPYTFKNLATSHCLDSNAAGSAYTLACNGGAYQKWTITLTS